MKESYYNRSKMGIKAFILALIVFISSTIMALGLNNGLVAQGYAQGMIVIEANTNRILAESNARAKLPLASTTKILTAITVIENAVDLDEVIKVDKRAAGVEGSSIYLAAGENITIRNLLYGLMLQSGNDCAAALAIHLGKSVQGFAAMMNQTAKRIGAKDSNFTNPHGLHDDNHYTTAYDLAIISSYGMKNPTFREIVGTRSIKMPWEGREYPRVVANKNKILYQIEGGNGIKTGYTKRAGRCLVASAKRGEMEVIAVVLNCPPMFSECGALINNAFSRYEMTPILGAGGELGRVEVEKSAVSSVGIIVKEGGFYPLLKGEEGRVSIEYDLPKSLCAPISQFDEVGEARAYKDGKLILTRKLYAASDIPSLSIKENLQEITEELKEDN